MHQLWMKAEDEMAELLVGQVKYFAYHGVLFALKYVLDILVFSFPFYRRRCLELMMSTRCVVQGVMIITMLTLIAADE